MALNRPQIREMTQADSRTVISLNRAVVHVTSPMDSDRFTYLNELSSKKLVAELNGDVVAFVMAIADGKAYDNGNYRWFSERLRNFIYVDRVVVSDDCRGHGIGRRLYSLVYDAALKSGVSNVCAEMDLEPPNVGSLRFHEQAGFVQIGTRDLKTGKKVSMQVRPITHDSRET